MGLLPRKERALTSLVGQTCETCGAESCHSSCGEQSKAIELAVRRQHGMAFLGIMAQVGASSVVAEFEATRYTWIAE